MVELKPGWYGTNEYLIRYAMSLSNNSLPLEETPVMMTVDGAHPNPATAPVNYDLSPEALR